jgi:hypothetical protein
MEVIKKLATNPTSDEINPLIRNAAAHQPVLSEQSREEDWLGLRSASEIELESHVATETLEPYWMATLRYQWEGATLERSRRLLFRRSSEGGWQLDWTATHVTGDVSWSELRDLGSGQTAWQRVLLSLAFPETFAIDDGFALIVAHPFDDTKDVYHLTVPTSESGLGAILKRRFENAGIRSALVATVVLKRDRASEREPLRLHDILRFNWLTSDSLPTGSIAR